MLRQPVLVQVASPDILFLDEPTSGLDSFAAFQVVKILQSLAASGRTVVTTIHQPSSECFEHFSDVLLLANGQLVYHSSVVEMNQYFKEAGVQLAALDDTVNPTDFVCRPNYNPADFVMFLMQQQSSERIAAMAKYWSKTVEADTEDVEAGRRPSFSATNVSEFTATRRAKFHKKLEVEHEKPGFLTQFWHLGRREVLNVVRDRGSLTARVGSTVFLNIIVACVFYKAASWEDVDGSSMPDVLTKVNAQFGILVQIAIGGMFGLAQPTLLAFPQERPVFLREYATGCYGAVPYFFSKMMAEFPVTICQSALIFLCTYVVMISVLEEHHNSCCCGVVPRRLVCVAFVLTLHPMACAPRYWLTGLAANFFVLTLVVALLGMVSSSTSLLIGAIANSVEVALQMTPLLFVPQLVRGWFAVLRCALCAA